MRVLWVKTGGVVPLDTGGKIRSYHLLRGLARGHSVTLFTYYDAHSDDRHEDLRPHLGNLVAIPLNTRSRSVWRRFLDYTCHLFTNTPYSMWKFNRHHVREKLRDVCAEQAFDLILCDFIQPAGIIPWDNRARKVIFTHNVEGRIWQRQAAVAAGWLWRVVYRVESRRLARAERRYLPKADIVLTVSNADREVFSDFVPKEKLRTVPTGVDTDYFRPEEVEDSDGIVFTGSMDWAPNEDAVDFFCEEILPIVRRRIPNAVFWVVGRKPSESLKKLQRKDPNVRITGTVDDIRPFFCKAGVYVVPLRSGSGTRLKIFEAMAAGKAVVSTTIGAEGLPVTDGDNIVIADEPEKFAGAVSELLQDTDKRERLGRSGRGLVEERFGWGNVSREFEAALGIDPIKV